MGWIALSNYQAFNAEFIPNEWADKTQRANMQEVLIAKKMLLGKRKVEVIQILGEPDKTTKTQITEKGELSRVMYHVRHDPLVSLDQYLCVDLRNDTVVRVYKFHEKQTEGSSP